MDIPIDNWVNADICLDPEGDSLPLDRLLESRAMQLQSHVQKPASAVLRDAVEPRIEESRLIQGYSRGLKQREPLQCVQFMRSCEKPPRWKTADVGPTTPKGHGCYSVRCSILIHSITCRACHGLRGVGSSPPLQVDSAGFIIQKQNVGAR